MDGGAGVADHARRRSRRRLDPVEQIWQHRSSPRMGTPKPARTCVGSDVPAGDVGSKMRVSASVLSGTGGYSPAALPLTPCCGAPARCLAQRRRSVATQGRTCAILMAVRLPGDGIVLVKRAIHGSA